MKPRKFTIFRRFTIVIISLIAILALMFSIITYLATTNYHLASTQLLNKDVARHVAEFTAAFTASGINKRKADSVFKNAMVLNPNAEVYFLDTSGKVIYFHASEEDIKEKNVALPPVKNYLAAKGERYIKGTDPKDPQNAKIFSAAEVNSEKRAMGYIYVILGSKQSEGIFGVLFGSHVLKLAIRAFIAVILLSLLFSFIFLKRVRKNFQQMIPVLEQFESGNYNARFTSKQQDELEPVTHAFNKMADLLSASILKLTKSEEERKNFIGIISHDLRTPLAIARGYTETLLLKKDKGDITEDEREHYSRLIYTKMLQIENMVKQLFELSKMEAVEFKPTKEPFVLSEIVQEAVNTFQLIALDKKIKLKCTQCLYHVWINADISMMDRVIQNLVENAVKSTTEGGFIQAGMMVDNDTLVFKIENEGPVLPVDLLTWINDYKEGDALLDRRPQKLGLGLIIVQKILHLHGTTLKAYTNGSNVFTFSLPVYNLPPEVTA